MNLLRLRISSSTPSLNSFSSSRRLFSSSPIIFPSPVVTPEWVRSHLPSLRLVESSWYLGAENRDTKKEFIECRVKDAVQIDQDECSDPRDTLPHMLSSYDHFASYVGKRGLTHTDNIVVYDTNGFFASPRGYYTFKHFGAKNVAILNGGLPAWLLKGFAVDKGPLAPVEPKIWGGNHPSNDDVVYIHEMKDNAAKYQFTVLDARSDARFTAQAKEARAGLRSGHIPNSISLPFTDVLNVDKQGIRTLKSREELIPVLKSVGINVLTPSIYPPIVTSCGSGMTACIIGVALESVGMKWRLYDGSWTEWGSRPDVSVETGSSKVQPITKQ